MNCVRCGRNEALTLIEEHHIIERLQGGSDDPENKEWRCIACHKYEHTKRSILASLERAKKQGQIERMAVFEHRKEVLEQLNTVELIRERGAYQSYWIDGTTHNLPSYLSKKRREQNQLVMELLQ